MGVISYLTSFFFLFLFRKEYIAFSLYIAGNSVSNTQRIYRVRYSFVSLMFTNVKKLSIIIVKYHTMDIIANTVY